MSNAVTFSDGSTITYSYAADGTKLRTVHTISGTTTTKDYCSNVVYENGVQKLLLTEEGCVDLSNSSYYYYLKDHQGNNRVVINSSGVVQETNHYYPFGGVFASSGNVQPYKYNGKELDTKKGLNWYDYGARHYDAALGRWFVVDPLAEKYHNVSPYVFTGNYGFNVREVNGGLFIFVNGFDPLKYGTHLIKYLSFPFNFLVGDLTYIPIRKFKKLSPYEWKGIDDLYKETVDYLAPFQPTSFTHPEGVLGRQFASSTDKFNTSSHISNIDKDMVKTETWNDYLGMGGHLFNDNFKNFLEKCFNEGIPIYINK